MYAFGKNGGIRSVSSKPKVGSYAQSSGSNKRPWFTETSATKKKTNVRKKRVVYPIFEECAKLTEDPFWKKKFEQASFNKFPRGFNFYNGLLMYKRGPKNEATEIPLDSPMEAFSISVFFFRNTASIFSDQDKILLKEEEEKEQLQQQLKEKTWNSLPRKQRDVLIDLYVEEMKLKYRLDKDAADMLKDKIILAVFYNVIDKTVIHLDEGVISHIDGLVYDKDAKCFRLEQNMEPNISKSSSKARKIQISPFPRMTSAERSLTPNFKGVWEKILKATTNVTETKNSKAQKLTPKITHVKGKDLDKNYTSPTDASSGSTQVSEWNADISSEVLLPKDPSQHSPSEDDPSQHSLSEDDEEISTLPSSETDPDY